MERRASPLGDRIVIALFGALLVAPAALALTGHAGFDAAFFHDTELRRPFVAPPVTSGALATGGWQRDAERQVADAFPLRRQLIRGYSGAKYYGLHDSASPNVIVGRDGWLFLGMDERDYLTGEGRPSDAVLAALADRYAARARWCAQQGITYALVLAPDKSTIYARYLPESVPLRSPTPADQFFPLLRARGVIAPDLRAPLIAASARGRVYSIGDTHWNDAGAYVAYREILRAVHTAAEVDEASLRPHTGFATGDLMRIAGISDGADNAVLAYGFPIRSNAVAAPAYPADPALATLAVRATARPDASGPVLVAFGDSFLSGLAPFLSETFRRAVYVQRSRENDAQFSLALVRGERPAIVIDEMVERNLMFGSRLEP